MKRSSGAFFWNAILGQFGRLGGSSTGGLYPAYRHYDILDGRNEYALGAVGMLYDSGTAKDNAVQPEAALRPSYVAGDYFVTNGVSQRLVMGAAPPEETMIMVVKLSATSNSAGVYGAFSTNPSMRIYFGVNLAGKLGVGVGEISWIDLDSGVTPPSGWCVVTIQTSQANHTAKMFLNGTQILNRVFTGTKYSGTMWLGGIYSVTYPAESIFGGHWYREFVQLQIIATDAQRIVWENRLKAKWGIS